MADPDSLADLPAIAPPGAGRAPTQCEDMLYIVMRAHKAATGEELPAAAFTVRRPELDEAIWDFGDRSQMGPPDAGIVR